MQKRSLSYWPGHADDANEWATNYAGHFMLEAKSLGYEIQMDYSTLGLVIKHKWLTIGNLVPMITLRI